MATLKQIEANRRNALRSTGPRTPAGKARSARNATAHGLTARTLVLAHEDDLAYEQLRSDLYASYQPVGAQEQMLVDQIAAGHWRILRSRRFEKALLETDVQTLKRKHSQDQAPDPEHDDQAAAVCLAINDHFKNYFRYDAAISRDFYRAVNALERLQARRERHQRELERRLADPRTHAVISPDPPHAQPPRRKPAVANAAQSETQDGFVSHYTTNAASTMPDNQNCETNPGLTSASDVQLTADQELTADSNHTCEAPGTRQNPPKPEPPASSTDLSSTGTPSDLHDHWRPMPDRKIA